ncbi:hypothetical protein T01_10140 [Trichinella spiralis]|uniref:Uncharacterized protein n=1 Tax=Trichinella spiralis TaxID=6334 RepID=A0A0V1BTF4_TRISP|nr:hypothetical protein T01_10140 [Trichinella spiralis]
MFKIWFSFFQLILQLTIVCSTLFVDEVSVILLHISVVMDVVGCVSGQAVDISLWMSVL